MVVTAFVEPVTTLPTVTTTWLPVITAVPLKRVVPDTWLARNCRSARPMEGELHRRGRRVPDRERVVGARIREPQGDGQARAVPAGESDAGAIASLYVNVSVSPASILYCVPVPLTACTSVAVGAVLSTRREATTVEVDVWPSVSTAVARRS